jgi:hypothetical protein
MRHRRRPAKRTVGRDRVSRTLALGRFDPKRTENDGQPVSTYIGIGQRCEPKTARTDPFLAPRPE